MIFLHKTRRCFFIFALILSFLFFEGCDSYNPRKRQPGAIYDVDRVLTHNTNLTGKYELKNSIIYFKRAYYDSLILAEYRSCEDAIKNGYPCHNTIGENNIIQELYQISVDTTDTLDISHLKLKDAHDLFYYLDPDVFIFEQMMNDECRVYNKEKGRFEDTVVLWDKNSNQTFFLYKDGKRILRYRQPKVRVKF